MQNKFKTKIQQLKLLRDKNVDTPNGSATILMETNYNELIKKYGKFFIDDTKSAASKKYKKIYKDNTSVTDIYKLLKFDRKLANLLLYEILDIEERVKSVFVYYTCSLKGEFSIYDKDAYDPSVNVQYVIDNISYVHNLVKRYIERDFISADFIRYGRIPFYVLSEFITLGELYKLMNSIDPVVTIEVANYFNLSVSQLKSFINLLSKFRNACAHNDAVFSYRYEKASIARTDVHIKYKLSSHFKKIYNNNLFACLLVIKHFKKKRDYTSLINQIDNLFDSLSRRCATINKDDLLDYIGVPKNYKNMLIK